MTRAAKLAARQPTPNPEAVGTFRVPLTRGFSAIIDAGDVDAVARHVWFAAKPGRVVYARTDIYDPQTQKGRAVYLHRFLWAHWGMDDVPEIDHRNTDGLDCRRDNLRAATSTQNSANTRAHVDSRTGVKGVYWNKNAGKWMAQIRANGKYRYLGVFEDITQAAAAYAVAATAAHGDFARSA